MTYRVRISRGEDQFEAEGDKRFVLEMLKRFDSGGVVEALPVGKGKAASKAPVPTPTALASSKAVSVGEFVRQFGRIKKHTDLVLAFAFYLEQHSGVKEFTPADINNLYYEARMTPSNTSQAIIQNIKRNCLMAAKGVKGAAKGANRYTLTSTGEAHIKKLATESAKDE